MMTDKALADTLELMASEIAALKRQIGELQQRERVDSNSFSRSTHAHPGIYLPLNANGVFEIGANDGVAGHALFDLHTSTTVRNYDARFGIYSGQTVFKIENLLGGGVDAAAPLMEAGQRVFSGTIPSPVSLSAAEMTASLGATKGLYLNLSTVILANNAIQAADSSFIWMAAGRACRVWVAGLADQAGVVMLSVELRRAAQDQVFDSSPTYGVNIPKDMGTGNTVRSWFVDLNTQAIQKGDPVGLRFYRQGAHATDSNSGNLYIISAGIEYL